MMTKTEFLEKMREKGAYDARQLQTKAAAGTVTQTEIIDDEIAVPAFDPKKDYSAWPVNSPVSDEGQVWLLLQPSPFRHCHSVLPICQCLRIIPISHMPQRLP